MQFSIDVIHWERGKQVVLFLKAFNLQYKLGQEYIHSTVSFRVFYLLSF